VVRRRPGPGNEAPEATGGGPKTLDAISVSSFLSAPSGKTYGTVRVVDGSTRLSTKCGWGRRIVSTKLPDGVDKLWTGPFGLSAGAIRSGGQPPIANISTLGNRDVDPDVAAERSSEYRSPRRDQTPSVNVNSASSEAPPRRTSRISVPSTANRQV
jgi:hypothetical protein